ncbi:MAG: hypothetical protein C4326_07445 [Ignavibacteria bacterium]
MKTLSLFTLVLCFVLSVSLSKATAQPKAGKIYWMSTATVPLGKMRDYHTFAEKELVPAQEKAGYRFVAGWQTIVGDIEEVIVVAEFDNMDAYQKARSALMSSPEWRSVSASLDSYTRGVRSGLMIALPFIK